MRMRRSVLLWAFAVSVLGLGIASGWRGIVLWRERALLYTLGSSLTPVALTVYVTLFLLCGVGLAVAALGLWWRRNGARWVAQACILLYAVTSQVYSWRYVRSGLMLERRWVSLAGTVFLAGLGVGALTWYRSRKWLGLG
jgi:hypothetical protein